MNRLLHILLFGGFLISSLLYVQEKNKRPQIINNVIEKIVYQCDTAFTPYTVYREIVKAGIKHPDVVCDQAMLETGFLNCDSCSLTKNNLFGFLKDTVSGYLVFNTWQESVYYYAGWQRRKNYDGANYYDFLKLRWGAKFPEEYVSELKSVNWNQNKLK
jgi:hypothetical protein